MLTRFPQAVMLMLATATAAACDTAPVQPTTPLDAVTLPSHRARFRSAPVTLAWQETARNLVSANNLSALAAARLYAAVGVAQARAVAFVDAERGAAHGRSRYEARRGAVAGASVRVLSSLAPAAAADLEQELVQQGEDGPGRVHPQFERGVTIGRAAGDDVVSHLMQDRFTDPWTGTIPVGPGLWTTTVLPPAGVMMGGVVPWFLGSGAPFRPAPPPALGSPAFEADLDEVLTITSNLTDEQRALALGWRWGGGTPTPPGYWNQLAASYVAAAGMDEAEATVVFAMMGAAVVDALITAFEAKYHYWTLRPQQADPAVAYAFPVPNYPAYPSGHGSVSASAARVLEHFFPDRRDELEALVDEAALSRLYAGIHYRFDMTAARTLGRAVAEYAIGKGLP